MKTASEINTEIRYWQGMLEGLKSSGGEPTKEKIIEAETTLRILHWVLSEPETEAKTKSPTQRL